MNKRIAMVMERADIALGGAERSVFELAAALSARGWEADILAAKGPSPSKNIHILCPRAWSKRAGYIAFERALKRHLSENRYDLVHSSAPFDFADVYQPRGGTYAESIVRSAASYQNKFVQSCKKLTAFANFRRSVLLRAEQKLCKEPNGPLIIALSRYVAKQFKGHYGLDDERIAIIPNGVRINKPIDQAQADKFRTKILRQLGLKQADNPALFLFVANNFRLKGLAGAIRAMKLAAEEHRPHPEVCLLVAGRDRPAQYMKLAKKLGVHRQIVFLGAVAHIQDVLSAIDVAILPTFYDPCSRFILEALAAQKPVITTKFNGAIDLFINHRHGKVIEQPQNVSELAEAIGYFTNTDNIQKASQAIVADNLKQRLSIDRVAGQLISIYQSILQKKG